MKKLLFHINKPPYSGMARLEEIETILFAASFGNEVNVVFSNQGVLQLDITYPSPNHTKNISKIISAFPKFDITNTYVCKEDLLEYNVNIKDLVIDVHLISRKEIEELIRHFEIVIN